MEKGDVLFYKGTSLIERGIAWAEKSPYTHVALYVGNNELIEANGFIVTRVRKITPGDKFEVHSFRGITDKQRGDMVNFALKFLGDPYAYGKILHDFFRLVLRMNVPIMEAKNKHICSDIIDLPAYAAGLKRNGLRPIGDVTPSELLLVYDLPKT